MFLENTNHHNFRITCVHEINASHLFAPGSALRNVLVDFCLQDSGITASQILNPLTVFEENERRHGRYVESLRDVPGVIDVDLEI